MRIRNKKTSLATRSLVALAVAAVVGIGSSSVPSLVSAAHMPSQYTSDIKQQNNTGVKGNATFKVLGNTMKVTIKATGLEPGVHPQHIHGKEEMKAECPTVANDTNKDGFISVIEGAPAYGPIKINLTSPQTAFGTPPTLALFTPFAGTADNANFPVVGQDGVLNFEQTYTFDSSEAAQAAKASLTELEEQHIVLHGGTAPKSVDADAFAALGSPFAAGTDLTVRSYDALLPVACGEIDEVAPVAAPNNGNNGNGNGNNGNGNNGNGNGGGMVVVNPGVAKLAGLNAVQAQLVQSLKHGDSAEYNTHVGNLSAKFTMALNTAVAKYNSDIAAGVNKDEARNQLINALSSAKDAELNGLTEVRNQHIDMLNRAGDVAKRDAFLNMFDQTVNQYAVVLEKAKNDL